MMPMNDQESFLAWARYLSWADLHKARLDRYFEEEGESEAIGHIGRFITAISHWYASLWVVAEGWRQLGLKDNFIDSILINPPGYADLLRRFRNGVYHYQPNLIEPRAAAFLTKTESTMLWANALHDEFIRVFWQYPEIHGLSFEESEEWRASANDLLGWLPHECVYAKLTEYERKVKDIEALLKDSGDTNAARELREGVESLRQAILQVQRKIFLNQQKYRESGWLKDEGT